MLEPKCPLCPKKNSPEIKLRLSQHEIATVNNMWSGQKLINF